MSSRALPRILCITDTVDLQLVPGAVSGWPEDLKRRHVRLDIASGAGSVRMTASDCRALATALQAAARELDRD